MYDIQHAVIFHGNEPAAVTVGRGGQLALLLQINLAFIIGCCSHLLFEEVDIIRVVSEEIMLF